MTKSILPPKSNTVFQLLFGDPRNIELLADFLQSVLDIPKDEYQDITIVNPFLPREYHDEKLGIVDLRVKTRQGEIIHVEIQRTPFPAMRERLVFYDASLVAGQIGEGGDYETLKRVISILITNYELIPKSQSPLYHHRFTLFDPRAAVELTNLLEIRTLELTKIPETPDVYLCNWLRFFRAETKEELDMVANASPAIAKATARVLKLSKDERARLIHEYEVKAQRDERARTNYAVATAVRGERARTRNAVSAAVAEVALNMLKMNMSPVDISKATGLSIDGIEKLSH